MNDPQEKPHQLSEDSFNYPLEFIEGFTARRDGKPASDNPYSPDWPPKRHRRWLNGWQAQEQAYAEKTQ